MFYNFRAEGKKKVARFETDADMGRIRVKLPNGTALCEYTTDSLMLMDEERSRMFTRHLVFCMWAAFKEAAEVVEAVPAGVDRNTLYTTFRNSYSERCSTLMSAPMSANGLPASVQL